MELILQFCLIYAYNLENEVTQFYGVVIDFSVWFKLLKSELPSELSAKSKAS